MFISAFTPVWTFDLFGDAIWFDILSQSFLTSVLNFITWIQPAVTELDLASVWFQWGDDHCVDLTAHDLWHCARVDAGLWAARVSLAASGDFGCVLGEGTAGPPAHNQRVIASSIETDAWGTAVTLKETTALDETPHLHVVIRLNRWHYCCNLYTCKPAFFTGKIL